MLSHNDSNGKRNGTGILIASHDLFGSFYFFIFYFLLFFFPVHCLLFDLCAIHWPYLDWHLCDCLCDASAFVMICCRHWRKSERQWIGYLDTPICVFVCCKCCSAHSFGRSFCFCFIIYVYFASKSWSKSSTKRCYLGENCRKSQHETPKATTKGL